jgi:PDZ domain-containing protein
MSGQGCKVTGVSSSIPPHSDTGGRADSTEGTDSATSTASSAGGRRRFRTVVVGLLPVVALVALLAIPTIPGTDVNLTVPFAAEGEGPTYDTLGEVNGTPVVDITGTDAELDDGLADSEGQLNMTTVAVRTKLSLAETMKRWLGSDDTIVPVEQVIPSDSTPEEVARRNAAAFAASESNATVAAMGYLDRPLETTVYEVADDAPAAGTLRENDVITAVDGTDVTLPAEVADAVAEHSPGDDVELTVRRGQDEVTESVTLGEVPEELRSNSAATAAETPVSPTRRTWGSRWWPSRPGT